VLRFYSDCRAAVGAFFRDLVDDAGRELANWESRDASIVLPPEARVVAVAEPSRPISPPRSGRLIDLERRAKFRQFDVG
jgi:hypothetical protein